MAAAKHVLTLSGLADLYGCSERQVPAIEAEGIAVRVARDLYDVRASTANYVAHLREQAARARKEADTVDVAYALDLWAVVLRGFREMVLGLPVKIGRELPHLTA